MAVNSGDVLRISNKYLFRGTDEQVNVFHMVMSNESPLTEAEVLTDVTAFIADAFGSISTTLPIDTVHSDTTVFNVTSGGPIGSTGHITAADGAESGDYLPPQTTALILFPTSVSRVQGRIYVPTTMESNNDGGNVVAGYVATLNDFADFFMSNYDAPSGAVYRYRVYGASGSHVPVSFRVVTKFRIQRRRTQGRGS